MNTINTTVSLEYVFELERQKQNRTVEAIVKDFIIELPLFASSLFDLVEIIQLVRKSKVAPRGVFGAMKNHRRRLVCHQCFTFLEKTQEMHHCHVCLPCLKCSTLKEFVYHPCIFDLYRVIRIQNNDVEDLETFYKMRQQFDIGQCDTCHCKDSKDSKTAANLYLIRYETWRLWQFECSFLFWEQIKFVRKTSQKKFYWMSLCCS